MRDQAQSGHPPSGSVTRGRRDTVGLYVCVPIATRRWSPTGCPVPTVVSAWRPGVLSVTARYLPREQRPVPIAASCCRRNSVGWCRPIQGRILHPLSSLSRRHSCLVSCLAHFLRQAQDERYRDSARGERCTRPTGRVRIETHVWGDVHLLVDGEGVGERPSRLLSRSVKAQASPVSAWRGTSGSSAP